MIATAPWRRALAIESPDRGTLALWRVLAVAAVASTVVLTHWPPPWLWAIPLFALDATIWRQPGGYALLTALVALARPLGRRRPWHLHVAAAAVILAVCVYIMQWTVPWVDPWRSPADAPRRCLGVLIALGVGMAAAPAADRVAALAWFWRAILIAIAPPCLLAAFMPGFDRQLMFLVPVLPGWDIRADHVGHFLGAMVVTICIMEARLCGLAHPRRGRTAGVGFMLLAGPMLEVIQGRVGRGQELGDVVGHELGVGVAVILVCIIEALVRGRTEPGSAPRRLAAALRRMRGRGPSIVALSMMLGVVDAVLFVPLAALVLRFFLLRWGRASVGNFEMAAFLLTPEGVASLLMWGGMTIALWHLELGGMVLLLARGDRRSWHVIWALRRYVLALLRLGFLQAAVLLLTSVPFLALGWGVYRTVWAGYDLNGLLVLKPPAFWIGVGLGIAVAGLYAAIAGTLLLRWALAPVIAVLEPTRCAWATLRRSAALTHQRRLVIGRAVAFCLLLVFGAGAVILGGVQQVSEALLNKVGSSLPLLLAVTAALLTAGSALGLAFAALGRAALAALLLNCYEERVPGVTPAEPGLPSPLPRRPMMLTGLVAGLILSTWIGHGLIAGLRLNEAVEITAHRGGALVAPENTVAAIRRAIADRADWAEIDVQLTADGQVVVLHDTDLLRAGGVRRRVAAMSLAQVQAIDVGSRFGPAFAGERVPTLDQILAAAEGRIRFNIELKPARAADVEPLTHKVIDAVRRAGLVDQCRICSQSYASLTLVRRLEPAIPVGFIAGKALGDLSRLDVDFLMVNRAMATRRLTNRAAARGMSVHAWTINDPHQLAALIDQGITNVITDDPAAMRARLDEIAALTVPQRLLLRARHLIAD